MAILQQPNPFQAPGRPTLPSQLQPIRPQPQPTRGVSQPRPQPQPQPYNPFVGGGPGRGPQVQPGGGGGMGGMIRVPEVPNVTIVGQPLQAGPVALPGGPGPQGSYPQPVQQQPPRFNLPSPVPDLRYQQPPATNLNTTPGQLGNQVTPPTGALGTAPPAIGGSGIFNVPVMSGIGASSGAYDPGYQQFLQNTPDYQSQYGGPQQAYGAYQQFMNSPEFAPISGANEMAKYLDGGGINNLPAMGGPAMGPTAGYGAGSGSLPFITR